MLTFYIKIYIKQDTEYLLKKSTASPACLKFNKNNFKILVLNFKNNHVLNEKQVLLLISFCSLESQYQVRVHPLLP